MPNEDRAAVRIFPPALPLVAVLLAVVLQRVAPLHVGWEVPAMLRYVVGGLITAAAVLGLGARAVQLMRRSGQNPDPRTPTPSMLTAGPYRFTRNPMYLMMILCCIGLSMLLANLWLLLLTPVCALLLQRWVIRHEEAYLERKFGAAYLAYKSRVRRWI